MLELHLERCERFCGIPSSARTTSLIGVENMRQMRSKVRNVIGFPASTFCQYRTEYPCDSRPDATIRFSGHGKYSDEFYGDFKQHLP